MADCGLSKFCAFLITLVLAENGSAINAISVQISQTLTVIATRLRVEKNETEILEILTEKFWYLGTEKPNKLK
jgi:hypothetical protein